MVLEGIFVLVTTERHRGLELGVFLSSGWRGEAGGHSASSTGPESIVPSAAAGDGGAGLRPGEPSPVRMARLGRRDPLSQVRRGEVSKLPLQLFRSHGAAFR